MYLDFYGLRERPFSETPDPRFLFLTPGHREALAQLIYGVQEGKGFIVLTGEVGTGKTTLLRTFMERIGTSSTHVAFIFDSTMPYDGLVEYMLEDFGIPSAGKTRAQRLFALNRFLIECRRAGQTAAVVVDEAQNLSLANLEHLRLLSNFETPTGKLLQIILVGQPELRDKLARPELRQLRQRLGMRCAIRPLTRRGDAELHPEPPPRRRRFRHAAVHGRRRRAHRRVHQRHPAPRQYRVRPLPAHRLRGADTPSGARDGRAGHRVFGRRAAAGSRARHVLAAGRAASAVARGRFRSRGDRRGHPLWQQPSAPSLRPARSRVNSSTTRASRATW